MTACIIGIRNVGGNSNIDRGFRCFFCGDNKAGFDLPFLVDSKNEGEKLTNLFNQKVLNCAWVDYRSNEPQYIQVKVYACGIHCRNLIVLSQLVSKSPSEKLACTFDPNKSHDKQTISMIMIDKVRIEMSKLESLSS